MSAEGGFPNQLGDTAGFAGVANTLSLSGNNLTIVPSGSTVDIGKLDSITLNTAGVNIKAGSLKFPDLTVQTTAYTGGASSSAITSYVAQSQGGTAVTLSAVNYQTLNITLPYIGQTIVTATINFFSSTSANSRLFGTLISTNPTVCLSDGVAVTNSGNGHQQQLVLTGKITANVAGTTFSVSIELLQQNGGAGDILLLNTNMVYISLPAI